jgi:methyltransferase
VSVEPALALLLGFTAVQRLAELVLSRRNLNAMRSATAARSGELAACESSAWYAAMVAVQILLLVAPAAENAILQRPIPLPLFVTALALWLTGQGLRLASIHALGRAWNARGAVSTTQTIVRTGPYRWIRHPNYLGVLLEGIALPLAGAAWYSLIFVNLLLIPVTIRRMRAEERLLEQNPAWREAFARTGRLLPKISQ